MPEVLTKHPDVARKVLESGGAKCGAGQKQQILKDCPAESFCTLPEGELCIYGLPQAKAMTQISEAELCQHTGGTKNTKSTGCHLGASADASAPLAALAYVVLLVWLRRRLRVPASSPKPGIVFPMRG